MSNTELTTEYGIRKPNGEEEWNGNVNTLTRGARDILTRSMEQVHKDSSVHRDFARFLASIADEAGIDRDQYIKGHTLLTRQRITVTLPAEPAALELQLGYAPDLEGRF